MKKLITIIACAVVAFSSCTKTETNTVTVTEHDTVSIRPSIVGSWKSLTGVSPIAFTDYQYTIQSYPSIDYAVVGADTIGDFSETDIIYPRWVYALSAHNDTLILTELTGVKSTDIYTKN